MTADILNFPTRRPDWPDTAILAARVAAAANFSAHEPGCPRETTREMEAMGVRAIECADCSARLWTGRV